MVFLMMFVDYKQEVNNRFTFWKDAMGGCGPTEFDVLFLCSQYSCVSNVESKLQASSAARDSCTIQVPCVVEINAGTTILLTYTVSVGGDHCTCSHNNYLYVLGHRILYYNTLYPGVGYYPDRK